MLHREESRSHVDAFEGSPENEEVVGLIARHGPGDDPVDDEQPFDDAMEGHSGAVDPGQAEAANNG